MTHTEIAHIDCAKCHSHIEFETYTTVDVSLNPELRKRFMTDEPFRVTCPHCGHQGWAEYEFLYQDLDHGFLLFYEPNPEHFEADAQMLTETYLADGEDVEHSIRIVHGLPNFWEKIEIFESDFDDRVIELQKFMVYAHYHQQEFENQPEQGISRIFFERGRDQVPKFLMGDDQQLVAVAPYTDEVYDITWSRYHEAIDKYGGGFFVNQQWAKWLMERAAEDQAKEEASHES